MLFHKLLEDKFRLHALKGCSSRRLAFRINNPNERLMKVVIAVAIFLALQDAFWFLQDVHNQLFFAVEEAVIDLPQEALKHALTPQERLLRQVLHNQAPEKCSSKENMRVLNIDKSYLFWNHGHEKICDLLDKMQQVDGTTRKGYTRSGRRANFLQTVKERVLVNLTLDCSELARDPEFGTGSWLLAFYMARIAVGHFKQILQFQCSDSSPNYASEIYPWLQGCYPYDSNRRWFRQYDVCVKTPDRANVHIGRHDIQTNMRHLVEVGTGYLDERPPRSHAINTTLFGNDIVLDQVALHFPCGNILGNQKYSEYGYVGFSQYVSRIPNDTQTIGIVTATSNPYLKNGACQRLIKLLEGYLKQHFPLAQVTVHADEPIPLAYIRLAVADVTIVGLTHFGAYPLLAGYGMNYFLKGQKTVNRWLDHMVVLQNATFQPIQTFYMSNKYMQLARGDLVEFLERWFVSH
jgi:hypothetical protein